MHFLTTNWQPLRLYSAWKLYRSVARNTWKMVVFITYTCEKCIIIYILKQVRSYWLILLFISIRLLSNFFFSYELRSLNKDIISQFKCNKFDYTLHNCSRGKVFKTIDGSSKIPKKNIQNNIFLLNNFFWLFFKYPKVSYDDFN